MIGTIKIYLRMLNMSIKTRMQYKVDFFIGIITIFLLNVVNFSMIGIMVTNFNDLNGWTTYELMFSYSLWVVSRGLYGVFFRHMEEFEGQIVTGAFDILLLKPLSPFVQYIGREINYRGIGDFLVGIGGVCISLIRLQITWATEQWGFFLACVVSGVIIQLSLSWIFASACFWTVRSRSGMMIVDNFNILIQKYPIDIFGRYFRIIVSSILPVAFLNYYPSVVLLGKTSPSGFYIYLTPLIAVLMLTISILLWSKGIKRYGSTGS